MDLVVVECKASKKMIIFIVLLIFLVVWVSLVMFAKQEAKSLLSKCGAPLPWIRSNSIIMMVRKLQELKEKGIIEEKEDVGECKFIIFILKGTLIIFPIIMILIITTTFFFNEYIGIE